MYRNTNIRPQDHSNQATNLDYHRHTVQYEAGSRKPMLSKFAASVVRCEVTPLF